MWHNSNYTNYDDDGGDGGVVDGGSGDDNDDYYDGGGGGDDNDNDDHDDAEYDDERDHHYHQHRLADTEEHTHLWSNLLRYIWFTVTKRPWWCLVVYIPHCSRQLEVRYIHHRKKMLEFIWACFVSKLKYI